MPGLGMCESFLVKARTVIPGSLLLVTQQFQTDPLTTVTHWSRPSLLGEELEEASALVPVPVPPTIPMEGVNAHRALRSHTAPPSGRAAPSQSHVTGDSKLSPSAGVTKTARGTGARGHSRVAELLVRARASQAPGSWGI